MLLQAFDSIRSERQLMERLEYNLLFRWFVGLSVDEPFWEPTVFTKNRQRMLDGDVAAAFMDAVMNHKEVKDLLSAEHFSLDGTLIEAWASIKSFRRKKATTNRGALAVTEPEIFIERSVRTRPMRRTTDPDARLMRKGSGKEAKLPFIGLLLMENRNGLVVDSRLTPATSTAERNTAIAMLDTNLARTELLWAPTRPTTQRTSSLNRER